ncbi:hypothetical protein [Salinibaculum rarum]|uniref:hypothetical protein n=1 Tax=Salinibaculum rarum TaxID=3058903 RepID=UPI00265DDC70|nr:hypothetical protein [Salinibaculum sp. KK48]
MILLTGTLAADLMIYLYSDAIFAPYTGLAVFSAGIIGGRYLSHKGFRGESLSLGFGGVLILQATYGIFGAGILSQFAAGIHLPAIAITAGIVLGIAAIITAAEYSQSLHPPWEKYMIYAGGIALVAYILGNAITGITALGGFLILAAIPLMALAFLFDYGTELRNIRSRRYSSTLNAIGVYVALAGAFVHILQLVLEAMGDN